MTDHIEREERPTQIAELIRWECSVIYNFFDEIFGEGISLRLFPKRDNLLPCLDAVECLIETAKQQSKRMKRKINKYAASKRESK